MLRAVREFREFREFKEFRGKAHQTTPQPNFLSEVVRCGALQKKGLRDSTRRTARRLELFSLRKSVESDFKEIVATLSKKNEMGAYTRYVTISFFEDKEANAP